jgi:hypothetical protein
MSETLSLGRKKLPISLLDVAVAVVRRKPGAAAGSRRTRQAKGRRRSGGSRLHPKVEMIEHLERLDRVGDGYLAVLDADQMIGIRLFPPAAMFEEPV